MSDEVKAASEKLLSAGQASPNWDEMLEEFLKTVPPDVATSLRLVSAKHGAEKFAFALNASRVSYGMQGIQRWIKRAPGIAGPYAALGDGAAFITEFACANKGWKWPDILMILDELDQAFAMAGQVSILKH